jgi:hypothetical protein
MKKRKIKVAFTSMVRVMGVLHLDDFSDEEVQACYCDDTEFMSMKTDVKVTAKLVEMGDLPNDTSNYCRRGTEYRTGEGARRRLFNKKGGRDVVFDEQDAQWDCDIFDQDAIASLYVAATRHCQIEAHRLALQDEREAREVHLEAADLRRTFDKLETGILTPLEICRSMRLRRSSMSNAAA